MSQKKKNIAEDYNVVGINKNIKYYNIYAIMLSLPSRVIRSSQRSEESLFEV